MNIYRIHVTLASGTQRALTGLFADGFEAVIQTLADFPGARRVAALLVKKGGAA